ncbi:hypothetical protein [Aegicerativicinus sediminis]|uniref:hypothetical protein n=1 Tax=Aegicerativicinus sediminis TaxID=2893202 RepID=UPI001E298156|nr:hypothetical protein [Aegicerativicinus sediminis]
MAEIKIEKKSPRWPYILIALVVVLVIAFVWYNNSENINQGIDNDNAPEQIEDKVDDMSMIMANYAGRIELIEVHS